MSPIPYRRHWSAGRRWPASRVVQGLRAQANARGRLADPALDQELTALRDHMDAMQQQLNEAQERIDFTERMLAQQRTPEQLPRT